MKTCYPINKALSVIVVTKPLISSSRPFEETYEFVLNPTYQVITSIDGFEEAIKEQIKVLRYTTRESESLMLRLEKFIRKEFIRGEHVPGKRLL